MSPAAKPANVTEMHEKATAAADATPDPLPMVEHETLAAALVAALAELTVVEKGRTAKIESKDSSKSFSYDYADLSDVVKLTRPVLARHGVIVLTPLGSVGPDLACSVVFLHASGDRLDFGPFTFPHGATAQATGSAVTYHRRYSLVAALGMAAGDDDDGAKASQAPAQPAFVWTVGAVKAALLNLFDGDKTKAAEAWRLGHGDNEPPDAGLAERLHDEWVGNQPADAPAEPEAQT